MKANGPVWMLLLLLLCNGCKEKPVDSTIAIRAKAEKGDAVAQYKLGRCYAIGQGVATNEVEAVKWIRKAAEQNYAEAQNSLGFCYWSGQGVAKDYTEAVRWYRKAADQNYAPAQYCLGNCYYCGQGVATNEVEAVKWIRKAAEQNYAGAQLTLGWCYAKGRDVAKDDAEAYKWSLVAAAQGQEYAMRMVVSLIRSMTQAQITEGQKLALNFIRAKWGNGDAEAQYRLGTFYSYGQGVAMNKVEAVEWFRKAAEQNYAQAQFALAVCYGKGDGVAKDYAQAMKWFRKAAAQNLGIAQISLAYCYQNGEGGVKDEAEAVEWFRKAAEQNYAVAQFRLGTCYYFGRGVATNEAVAANWYRKAAEQDYPWAQYNLGHCYANGRGVVKDEVEAAKWWRKAAERNNADAQINLGWCYVNGKGVAGDYVEAYKWCLLASEQGYEDAKKRVAALADWMTRKQIAEGQELARNFKPQQVPAFAGDGLAPSIAEDVGAGLQLPAQQSEFDRKLLADLRTKAESGDAHSQYELGNACVLGRLGAARDEVEAVNWYRKAANSGEVHAFSALARILATSENSDIRDGSNAVFLAEKAVAATNRKTPVELDTLAAAYAEVSQFEKAASTEQEAIALLQTEAEKKDYRTRLRFFEVHLPYRAKD